MVEQKKTVDLENRKKALELALAQIEKQFGKGSIMKMDGAIHLEIEVIPTGCLSLDLALGVGGVPRGRVVEIYGPESSGKTTLTLSIIAQIQKNQAIKSYPSIAGQIEFQSVKEILRILSAFHNLP